MSEFMAINSENLGTETEKTNCEDYTEKMAAAFNRMMRTAISTARDPDGSDEGLTKLNNEIQAISEMIWALADKSEDATREDVTVVTEEMIQVIGRIYNRGSEKIRHRFDMYYNGEITFTEI